MVCGMSAKCNFVFSAAVIYKGTNPTSREGGGPVTWTRWGVCNWAKWPAIPNMYLQ